MHYELWGLDSGNRIATSKDEASILDLARSLVEVGWTYEELALGVEPDTEDESTEPGQTWQGKALEERVLEFGSTVE